MQLRINKPCFSEWLSALLMILFLIPSTANAKKWGKDTKVHELFGGKYIFEINEHFELTDCNSISVNDEVQSVHYKYPGFDNAVTFTLTQTNDSNIVKESYMELIKNLRDEYHVVNPNSFTDNNKSGQSCIIFCKLKKEYYEPGKWFEYEDGTMSPYWQAHVMKYQNGELFTMTVYYNHDKDWAGVYQGFFNLPVVRFMVPDGQSRE